MLLKHVTSEHHTFWRDTAQRRYTSYCYTLPSSSPYIPPPECPPSDKFGNLSDTHSPTEYPACRHIPGLCRLDEQLRQQTGRQARGLILTWRENRAEYSGIE